MSDAARQKRRRIREALGLAVYGVEVGGNVMDALEMAGLANDFELADRKAVEAALAEALKQWADDQLASRVTRIATGMR